MPKQLPKSTIKKARDLYRQGFSLSTVAQVVGISESTTKQVCATVRFPRDGTPEFTSVWVKTRDAKTLKEIASNKGQPVHEVVGGMMRRREKKPLLTRIFGG